jgi:hypothetical protein
MRGSLTPDQKMALTRLCKATGWATAYEIDASPHSLSSLFRRGLARRRGGVGVRSILLPVEYLATDAGREWQARTLADANPKDPNHV